MLSAYLYGVVVCFIIRILFTGSVCVTAKYYPYSFWQTIAFIVMEVIESALSWLGALIVVYAIIFDGAFAPRVRLAKEMKAENKWNKAQIIRYNDQE